MSLYSSLISYKKHHSSWRRNCSISKTRHVCYLQIIKLNGVTELQTIMPIIKVFVCTKENCHAHFDRRQLLNMASSSRSQSSQKGIDLCPIFNKIKIKAHIDNFINLTSYFQSIFTLPRWFFLSLWYRTKRFLHCLAFLLVFTAVFQSLLTRHILKQDTTIKYKWHENDDL